MHYLKEGELETLQHIASTKAFQEVKKADFVLHNTVQELESETLDDLNKKQPNYAIGPLSNFLTKIHVTKSMWSESDCTKWLESKPLDSVLYVSFGSLIQTNKHLIQEIAHGLLLTQIKILMSGIGSLGLKQEIQKLKNVLHKAIEKDGSSERNFDKFVKDLKAKIYT
ncbi:hypothetical protein ACJIZ3_021911 [Penstemon smallii]|uniref:Uncharacterized protein n=1 Tax=Penstemon smallii TaxID=265156 RepID=A0ABD3SN10_9LAMI